MAYGAILGQKPQIPQPVDTVRQGNMNAVTSNAVYEAIQAIPEPTGGKWELVQEQFTFSEWHMATDTGTFVRITSNINLGFPSVSNIPALGIKNAYQTTLVTGITLAPKGSEAHGLYTTHFANDTILVGSITIDKGNTYLTFKTEGFNVGTTTQVNEISPSAMGDKGVLIEYFVPND